MVHDDNEYAPVCTGLAVVSINVITFRRIKNIEELISLLSQVSVAMITSGEVVSIKTSIFFPVLRICWQFIVTIRFFWQDVLVEVCSWASHGGGCGIEPTFTQVTGVARREAGIGCVDASNAISTNVAGISYNIVK